MSNEFRFPDAPAKDPGEAYSVELDCFAICANFWRPNEQYSGGDYVRPNRPTGFAYQASGGTSAAADPRWPVVLGLTVVDGSITWTCVAAAANGLNAVSAPSAASDPVGLTISGVVVSETTKILATYAIGGITGRDYTAVYTFTLNGQTRIARQKVPVRLR